MDFMTDTHYLTEAGREKLAKELETLMEQQKAVTVRIEEAIKMGDLSENAEYSDAKEEQAFVVGRIAEIKNILKNSEIIKKSNDSGIISIGATVKVKFNGSQKTFTIVGSEEADPIAGLISHESPLGKAFLNHKKGDKVEVETPAGTQTFQILSVS